LKRPWLDHERPQTFSMGGHNFPGGGGQKQTICLKNTKRDTIVLEKIDKHTILLGQGGQKPPLALPCGRPCF